MIRVLVKCCIWFLMVSAAMGFFLFPRIQSRPPPVGQLENCPHWCHINHEGRPYYYCCDVREKSGFCPEIKPQTRPWACPDDYTPKQCYYDTNCRGTKKCCSDRCLSYKVCKASTNNWQE